MPKIDRRAIYERDGGLCGFCGQPVPFEIMHLDHYPIARSHNGPTTTENLRVAHQHYNQADAARVASQTKATLRPDSEYVPFQVRFPVSLRKRALGVAQDEDRTFASLVIYALRRYVEQAEKHDDH